MSDVMRWQQQLSGDSRQTAGGLPGFKSKLVRQDAVVQSLIAGTATETDKEVVQIVGPSTRRGRADRERPHTTDRRPVVGPRSPVAMGRWGDIR
jgi:hypothetical protein